MGASCPVRTESAESPQEQRNTPILANAVVQHHRSSEPLSVSPHALPILRELFELNNFYDEFAKPWDRRRLPMRYEPRDAAIAVYEFWQERNGGDRRVQGAPRAESI